MSWIYRLYAMTQSQYWRSMQSAIDLYMKDGKSMVTSSNKRIAIICDWLIDFGWAELVISHLLELFPEADIFTSVCHMQHPMLEWRRVYTSWIQHIPFLNKKHKLAGILRPWAFRNFDLREYDIVISSSSAEAKNAGFSKRKPWAKHFCYCHTPIRYYWSHFEEYQNMMEFGLLNPIARWALRFLIHWLRKLDYEAAQKVDYFIANSENTKKRIQQYYDRESEVIYPGINIPSLDESVAESGDSYISVGRCIPYKKFDLLVEAFNQNRKKLTLCTATDTSFYRELREKSASNIEWKFRVSHEEKNKLLQNAKAFLFPPEEDFGLVPLEAMALGVPVIAYGKWGALETVIDGKTGVFFTPQTAEALNETIEKFESMTFQKETIRDHAHHFSKEQFQEKILHCIEKYA